MGRHKNDGLGKIGGRQKGTPNKFTKSLREFVADIIDQNRSKIESDLEALEPVQRLAIIERLMAYVIPKQNSVNTQVEIDNLTDSQIDSIIDKIKGK